MNWLWISGWAIPPAWLARQARVVWPEAHHTAVSPSDAAGALAAGTFDRLAGYSLGSLWLLQHAQAIPKGVPVFLFAPILAFPAEAGVGGRVALTPLKQQRRCLRRDAPAAVVDFLRRAGLEEGLIPLATAALTPARIAELDSELGWLQDWRPPASPPAAWQGFVGDHDPLLDAMAIQRQWPTVHVVAGGTHAPDMLLRAAAPPVSTPLCGAVSVVNSFDRAADDYEAHAAPQAALAAALAAWVEPADRRGRAVEFGAGTGVFTRRMLPWNGSYLATDAAPRMVARGREGCPGVTWKVAHANTADLDGVDWIFACGLLQWMDQPAATLRVWRGLMAPHGRLAVAIFIRDTLGELQSLLPEARVVNWHGADEWESLLAQSGFALERAGIWEQTAVYPTARQLLRMVHTLGLAPRPAVGPGRLRAALRSYDEQFAVAGGVRATWRAWLARAAAV